MVCLLICGLLRRVVSVLILVLKVNGLFVM